VELYSCGCCNEEEPCPHGYGYKELDVDEFFEEQSTIYLSDEDDECVDDLIDNGKMEIPVKLSKNQKKNLKKWARKKKYKGVEECNEYEPQGKKMWPKDVRRNAQNYEKCEFEISSLQGDKVKKEGCTIAHLLSNDELKSMNENGTVIVHVMKLYYPNHGNGKIAKEIYWTVVGVLPLKLTKTPIKQSMVIIITYNQVQHDVRF